LSTDYTISGSDVMHPTKIFEFAAYMILAAMDVLSTVFKTREHTAQVRLVGNWIELTRWYRAGAGWLLTNVSQ
jgi:hypothetical protein